MNTSLVGLTDPTELPLCQEQSEGEESVVKSEMRQRSAGGTFIATEGTLGSTLKFPSKYKGKALECSKAGTEVI